MIDTIVDPECEIVSVPPEPTEMSHQRPDGSPSAVPGHNQESVKAHAEEFVVEWMAGAVQKAKRAIVDEAMRRNPTVDMAELDKAIIKVISGWDYSQDPQ